MKEKGHFYPTSPKIGFAILGRNKGPEKALQCIFAAGFTPSPKINSGILGEGREEGREADKLCMHTPRPIR